MAVTAFCPRAVAFVPRAKLGMWKGPSITLNHSRDVYSMVAGEVEKELETGSAVAAASLDGFDRMQVDRAVPNIQLDPGAAIPNPLARAERVRGGLGVEIVHKTSKGDFVYLGVKGDTHGTQ